MNFDQPHIHSCGFMQKKPYRKIPSESALASPASSGLGAPSLHRWQRAPPWVGQDWTLGVLVLSSRHPDRTEHAGFHPLAARPCQRNPWRWNWGERGVGKRCRTWTEGRGHSYKTRGITKRDRRVVCNYGAVVRSARSIRLRTGNIMIGAVERTGDDLHLLQPRSSRGSQ